MRRDAWSFTSTLRVAIATLCAISSLLCGGQLAWAQSSIIPEHYVVDTWQVEDGLPENRIAAITQTKDGYLWIGTYNGLVRFDGVRFTVFDSRTPGLGVARIASLFADHSGGLWVGLEYGRLVHYAEGRFTDFSEAAGWEKKTAICFTEHQDELLIGTEAGGVVRRRDQRFVQLLEEGTPSAISNAWFSGPMNLASESRNDGVLWTRTPEGLKILRGNEWVSRALWDRMEPMEISAVAPARQGGVWVCAAGRLALFNGDAPPVFRGEPPRRSDAGITGLAEDSAGNVWLSTWGKGLVRIGQDGSTKSFTQGEGVPLFLFGVFVDQEENIWIGSNGEGLLRMKPRVFSSYTPVAPLPAYHCVALAANPEGGVWIGTEYDGLVQWKENQFSVPITLADLPPERHVRSLAVEPSGRLWIGTYSDGVFAKDRVSSFRKDINDRYNRVWALAVARDGAVWMGTASGVSRYDGSKFQNFTSSDGLPDGPVRVIEQDASGELWFGMERDGLALWREGRFEVFRRDQGLADNSIRCLRADEDGTLWIGTESSGLSRWRAGKFMNFRVEDGLPDGNIVTILDDGLGYLWLGSGHGVFRVARQVLEAFASGQIARLDCARYSKGEGLASAQCAQGSPSGIRTSDGRLWFATAKGLSVVNPAELPTNPVAPPVCIEEVLIDDKPVASEAVRVPPGRRRLEIRYTGLSFTAPDRVRFKQRLEGFDEAWRDVGNQRSASFQGLPPATYRFSVTAANNDGVWNPEGATLAFTVEPELWQRLWFRAVIIAALAGVAFALARGRIARLQRQQQAQHAFSRGLLQSQEAERRRIAAELHDSLGQNLAVVKNLALLDSGSPASQGKGSANAAEIAAAAQRALDEVHAISYALRPPELDRLGLAKALVAMVRRAGESSGIRFETHIKFEGVLPEGSDIQLFRIAQEAVNNLVKHSGAKTARVELWRDEGGVHLVIADDGRGLAGSDGTAGLGISSIEERARLLGAQCKWLSAPGEGTTLSVLVPV